MSEQHFRGAMRLVRPLVGRLARQPYLRRCLLWVLDHIPALQTRVHAMFHGAPKPRRLHVPLDRQDLSPRMQSALEELAQYFKPEKR